MMLTMNTYQGALRAIIRKQMLLGGMKPHELSTAAGFHADYLQHVLGGRRDVTTVVLKAVSPFLCMSVAEICRQARLLADGEED